MPDDSLRLARADLELLASAYPDELSIDDATTFPLSMTLALSETAHCQLELVHGYPTFSNVQIKSYRCSSKPEEKARMEATLAAIRTSAAMCLTDGIEGGLACCSVAMDTWKIFGGATDETPKKISLNSENIQAPQSDKLYLWFSGPLLEDRKSVFQAHACEIAKETDVQPALLQLIHGTNSKIQKAYHNMVRAYDVQLLCRLAVMLCAFNYSIQTN
jgi:hypothetical protein